MRCTETIVVVLPAVFGYVLYGALLLMIVGTAILIWRTIIAGPA